jgi:AraC-like DNA-binding protein
MPGAALVRSTLEELARDPVGKYAAGETFAHFCARPALWGVVLWGRPDEAAAIELGKSLVLELAPPAQKHASIVDASRLESGSEGAFGALERYVSRYGTLLQEWVTKLAIVRSRGLGGAIVAGAQDVLSLPYPVGVFDDPRAACEWLGEASPVASADMLTHLYEEASHTPPFLGALRSLLDGHLRDELSIAVAAKKLALSERTLQRKLGEAGTTFQHEVSDARVRAAKRMLLDPETPLTTIALESGCASLQHFNTLFRKRTGELPSAWRARQRTTT